MPKDRFSRNKTRDRLRSEARADREDRFRIAVLARKEKERQKKEKVRTIRNSIILEAALKKGVFKGDITKTDITLIGALKHPSMLKELNRRQFFSEKSKHERKAHKNLESFSELLAKAEESLDSLKETDIS